MPKADFTTFSDRLIRDFSMPSRDKELLLFGLSLRDEFAITTKYIARITGRDNSTITRSLARLRAKGYVDMEEFPLKETPKGKVFYRFSAVPHQFRKVRFKQSDVDAFLHEETIKKSVFKAN